MLKILKEKSSPRALFTDILPLKSLLTSNIESNPGLWICPYNNLSLEGVIVNQDKDPEDFLKSFEPESVNGVIYIPPFSTKQVSEFLTKRGKTVSRWDTSPLFWSVQKDIISKILKPNGVCITVAWNSSGLGSSRGFKQEEILLLSLGGLHNDNIITVERKIPRNSLF